MINRVFGIAMSIGIFCLSYQTASAQEFLKIDDQGFIQLLLDQIRKGVQQEDTAKLFAPFAQQVYDKEGLTVDRAELAARCQSVFENSSSRATTLERPTFTRTDNPLQTSNFWDFDILDPHISINGDTALVDCGLVLWGAVGGRTTSKFVFVSPKRTVPVITSDRYSLWPSAHDPRSDKVPRSWQLVRLDNLLEFLEKHGQMTPVSKGKPGEEQQ